MFTNLTTMLLLVQNTGIVLINILLLVYFPLDPKGIFRHDKRRAFMRARIFFFTVLAICVLINTISAIVSTVVKLSEHQMQIFAQVIGTATIAPTTAHLSGLISAATVIIQWMPQIFTTWKLEVSL